MHATSTAVLIFLAILSVAASFAPTAPCLLPEKSQSMTHPRSSSSHDQHRLTAIHPKNIAASMMLVTGLLLSADPALAFQDGYLMQSTSLPHMLVAGRSGGRAGGRASPRPAARARAPAARAPSAVRSSTTIVRPMIVSPPVVVSPFGYGYGYGNPMGGFGLGYGLGAMNSAADSMRDYRQEGEIQRERAELDMAKQREADLEARIKQLEQAQMNQGALVAQ